MRNKVWSSERDTQPYHAAAYNRQESTTSMISTGVPVGTNVQYTTVDPSCLFAA